MIAVYILIKTRQGKMKIVSSSLKEFEELEEVHETLGSVDIIVRGLFEDLEELKSFIQNKLQITEGIVSSETLIIIN